MNADLPIFELEYAERGCECCGGIDNEQLWNFVHFARTQSGYYAFRMGNVICLQCGFVYVPNSPTDATLETYYNDTYPAGAFSKPTYHAATRIRVIESYAGKGARLVDIGSSREEEFHVKLKEVGIEVLRMDIKGHAMTDTDSIDAIEKGSADVVTHYFVLEHVPHIREFLANCRAILKDEGIMVIEVPNIRSYEDAWLGILPHEHVNHWSPGCLARVVSECGFQVLESGQGICSRNPIGFAMVCRKVSMATPAIPDPNEFVDNRRCFISGANHVRAYEFRLGEMFTRAQANLAEGGSVLLWCANDQMHRFFQIGGKLEGDFLRVDSDVRKRNFFGPETVKTPAEASDFIHRSTRILVFSDINAEAILTSIKTQFGKHFEAEQIERPHIHQLC
jgi:SAM-dependent methyltransferase